MRPLIMLLLALASLPLTGCAIAMPIVQHQAAQKNIARSSGHAGSQAQIAPAVETFRKLSGGVVGYQADIRVGWDDIPHLNARSAGGGHFALSRGLLAIAPDNACLIWGVVAHELAHDMLDHPAQQLRAQVAIGTVATASAFIPFAGLVAPIVIGTAGQAAMLGYNRSQEADADAKAVELLARAGLPIWSLRYTLEFMRDVHGESGGAWTSSHPLTGERIAGQPPIKVDEAATLCPSPEVRAAQVAATGNAVRIWVEQAAERRAAMEKQAQERQRESDQETCRANRTC